MNNILIIEDDLDISEVISEMLELHDYKTEIANDGEEGLKLAKTKQPNLIISDVSMPKMNGYEMLEALRGDAIMIPCIFLSAKAQKEDVLKGKASKAEYYLTKPFTMKDLLNTVKKVLDK